MPVKTYAMPLISSGLRQEEFIRQMVDSLEYLEAVSSDIFNRISRSVAEQRDKLVDVNTRINKAEAQVEKLKSSRTKGKLHSCNISFMNSVLYTVEPQYEHG